MHHVYLPLHPLLFKHLLLKSRSGAGRISPFQAEERVLPIPPSAWCTLQRGAKRRSWKDAVNHASLFAKDASVFSKKRLIRPFCRNNWIAWLLPASQSLCSRRALGGAGLRVWGGPAGEAAGRAAKGNRLG